LTTTARNVTAPNMQDEAIKSEESNIERIFIYAETHHLKLLGIFKRTIYILGYVLKKVSKLDEHTSSSIEQLHNAKELILRELNFLEIFVEPNMFQKNMKAFLPCLSKCKPLSINVNEGLNTLLNLVHADNLEEKFEFEENLKKVIPSDEVLCNEILTAVMNILRSLSEIQQDLFKLLDQHQ
jgi:hypothetical protein